MIWTDGSALFSFGKDGSDVLASCSLCGTKTALFFSAGPVRSSFSAEACAIVQALHWFWQHQQRSHFSSLLLFDSRFVLATMSSFPSFILPQSLSGRSGRSCFLSPPLRSVYSGSSDTRFSLGTTRLMSWPDGECCSCSLQSLVVSLSSYLSYPPFSFLEMEVNFLI